MKCPNCNIEMKEVYSMKFKDFEIRKPTLLQEPGEDYYKYNFDLVKWDDDKDGTKYCYSQMTDNGWGMR